MNHHPVCPEDSFWRTNATRSHVRTSHSTSDAEPFDTSGSQRTRFAQPIGCHRRADRIPLTTAYPPRQDPPTPHAPISSTCYVAPESRPRLAGSCEASGGQPVLRRSSSLPLSQSERKPADARPKPPCLIRMEQRQPRQGFAARRAPTQIDAEWLTCVRICREERIDNACSSSLPRQISNDLQVRYPELGSALRCLQRSPPCAATPSRRRTVSSCAMAARMELPTICQVQLRVPRLTAPGQAARAPPGPGCFVNLICRQSPCS